MKYSVLCLCGILAACAVQEQIIHQENEFNNTEKWQMQDNWVQHEGGGKISFSLVKVILNNAPHYELIFESRGYASYTLAKDGRVVIYCKSHRGQEEKLILTPFDYDFRATPVGTVKLSYHLTDNQAQEILNASAISFKIEKNNGQTFSGHLTPENIANIQEFKKKSEVK